MSALRRSAATVSESEARRAGTAHCSATSSRASGSPNSITSPSPHRLRSTPSKQSASLRVTRTRITVVFKSKIRDEIASVSIRRQALPSNVWRAARQAALSDVKHSPFAPKIQHLQRVGRAFSAPSDRRMPAATLRAFDQITDMQRRLVHAADRLQRVGQRRSHLP